jgi:Leucine-rich repeat (LRR) protein
MYIDLRNNQLTTLPESICKLPNLEKLDLRWNHQMQRPNWIRYLEEKGCIILY